ncbi:MAG: PGF-pre-PGF domain-containing protein, partial [Candidatus Methanoperedens sp.]
VKLLHWDGSKWNQLDTAQTTQDGTYTYYEAKTTALSPFAISGITGGAVFPTATPSFSEIVDNELRNLPIGPALFNTPQEMKVGETDRITVRIAKTIITKVVNWNNNNEIINFLNETESVDLKDANIEKSSDGKEITVTAGAHSYSLSLNKENNTLVLKTNYNEMHEYAVKMEKESLKIYQENFTVALGESGKSEIDEIKVSTLMKVHLTEDNNFEIKPLSEEEQPVVSEGFTQWEWDVTPLKSGKQVLKFSVSVVIGGVPKTYPVFEKVIYVEVNPIFTFNNFIGNNWLPIIELVIAALGLFAVLYPKELKKLFGNFKKKLIKIFQTLPNVVKNNKIKKH